MLTTEVAVHTGNRLVTDLTDDVQRFCLGKGDGLVNLLAPHATAGIGIMELGSGSEADLEELIGRLFPRHDRYRHRHGAPGHGADHLVPVVVSPSLTLPVEHGHVLLGRWQRVVMVDPNGGNPERRLRLSFLAG
jgi:secondary thiamine-phosphate synthase enzyme